MHLVGVAKRNSKGRFLNFFLGTLNKIQKYPFVDLSKLYTCLKFHQNRLTLLLATHVSRSQNKVENREIHENQRFSTLFCDLETCVANSNVNRFS